MRILFLTLLLVATAACSRVTTAADFGAAGKTWHLLSIDDAPYEADATINFLGRGEVSGQAPCNRWFATLETPYPWFSLNGVGATKRACEDLNAEAAFFSALSDMSLVEVLGDVLVLSNDAGRTMLFEAR